MEPATPRGAAACLSLVQAEAEVLIAGEAGLGAWIQRIPPDCQVPMPSDKTCGGRFHIVVSGNVYHRGQWLPPLSTVWSSSDDQVKELDLVAGPEGAEVVVTQFPTHAWAFVSPPQGPEWLSKHRPPEHLAAETDRRMASMRRPPGVTVKA